MVVARSVILIAWRERRLYSEAHIIFIAAELNTLKLSSRYISGTPFYRGGAAEIYPGT